MKYTIILTIVFMLLSTQANALDFLGPPMAGLEKEQSSIGIEYVRGETDVEAEGVFGLFDAKIKDVELNKIYFRLSTGMAENCELFLRVGGAKADVDKGSNMNNLGYYFGESDNSFSIGGGTKITIDKSDNVQWGLIAQLSYANITDFDGLNEIIPGIPVSLEAEVLETQFALGPTAKLSDTASIYGGAMFHFLDGEAKATEETTTLSETSALEQDSVFGGYIGLGLQIAENSNLNIEYQITGDSQAVGAGMVFKFGDTRPDIPTTTRSGNDTSQDMPTTTVSGNEIRMIEEIDPNKTLLGWRVETDLYGRRTKIPVYEEDEQ
ncbi:hypothetical protein ACFLZ8_00035 [Planctomycetota bacterium]